jgi:ATP-binding cassette, subfamily B, bacterial PglK
MKIIKKPFSIYINIWNLFRDTKKKLFFFFLAISLTISLLEITSIVMFMNIVNFASAGDLPILSKFEDIINLDKFLIKDLFYIISGLFLLIILLLIFLKFVENEVNCKISFGTIYDFNNLIFNKLAFLNFLDHKKININQSISNLTKVNDIITVLIAILSGISSIITAIAIIILLLFIDLQLVLVCLVVISSVYFVLTSFTKRKLFINSQIISKNINLKTNNLSLLMGSLRNIILDKLQNFFVKNFSDAEISIKNARTSNAVISFIPSMIFINLILFIFVAIVVIHIFLGLNLIDNISKYAALAFGAQKLIPLFNKIYLAISRSRANHHGIFSVLTFIKTLKNQKEPKKFFYKSSDKTKIIVKKNLILNNIKFRYPESSLILNNLDLKAKIGDKILIQGDSGAGKTTLIDIITGLITANSGNLKIDGKKINKKNLDQYQKNISLIPQDIFIAEQSFTQNIALGFSKKDIDLKKVQWCAKMAEINQFIINTKNKYNSIISHNGSNLSGGQKQRIGIARGLYKDSDILVFDESTNSLDEKTEKKIFKNFNKYLKNKIVIFISHDKKNIRFFNKIFVLMNGKLKKSIHLK